MRWTQYFINTLREDPSDADVISQKLMMRAAMIRKVAAGIYTYLPLGLRAIKKMEQIVREEMNRSGAVELLMPAIQPAELWMESGRWYQYGKELLRIKDRGDRDFVFGPTHEEVITDAVRDSISSYRQLPINLYQIQTKFRDEVRPRFGLMRGREFVMKDAYSFHASHESLNEAYEAMRLAYTRIFGRCGLEHITVEADTGNIGGSASQEFMVLAQSGEDAVIRCPKCGYGANVEKAEMARGEIAPHDSSAFEKLEEISTPDKKSIEDVAAFLEVAPEKCVKTLVFETETETIMVLLPGDREANEIKIKNFLGAQHLTLAGDSKVEKATGAPTGFAGPIGVDNVRIVADVAIKGMTNVVVGANKKDTHYVNANAGRDFVPSAFGDFILVREGDPCPRCSTALQVYRGIEVGHIFKLGTKYSAAMNCTYLTEAGDRQPMIMGCYGLGVTRTVAAAIEQSHDDAGIIWPMPLAPFEAIVIAVGPDAEVQRVAREAYEKLQSEGIEVLFDDRDERPGVKFKDADLIGFPLRIVVGAKSLANGQVEWSFRKDRAKQMAAPAEAVARVVEEVRRLRSGI